MGGVAGRHRGSAGSGQRRRGRPASRTSHLQELIMSRYELTPRNDQPDVIKAVVGWARPLQTYFAQVFTSTEAEPEAGAATIWPGTEPGELLPTDAARASSTERRVGKAGVRTCRSR